MEKYGFPHFHLVPVVFEAKTEVILNVEQEEWHYQKGNDSTKVTIADCLPWEELSRKAINCSNKCLPVVYQFLWKETIDRQRCHNVEDHMCMMVTIGNEV